MYASSFVVALTTPPPWHIAMPSGGGVHSIALGNPFLVSQYQTEADYKDSNELPNRHMPCSHQQGVTDYN